MARLALLFTRLLILGLIWLSFWQYCVFEEWFCGFAKRSQWRRPPGLRSRLRFGHSMRSWYEMVAAKRSQSLGLTRDLTVRASAGSAISAYFAALRAASCAPRKGAREVTLLSGFYLAPGLNPERQ